MGDKAEYRGKIIQQSIRDGEPRVTNIQYGCSSNKVRVGNWDHLDDPAVCQLCSYLLLHKCSLTDDFGVMQHCKDCCKIANQLHLKLAAEKYKEALQQT